MNYITSPPEVVPYNTGKVRIGSNYAPPVYIEPPTPTMYRLQTSMLNRQSPRGRPSALIRALTFVFHLIVGRE